MDGRPAGRGPASARTTLRDRNFRLLWVGSIASAAGSSIGAVVITWALYSSTHSPLALTLLGVSYFAPTLAFGLFAGALIDRWNRRRMMIWCDLGRTISLGALAVYIVLFGASLVAIIAVALAVAAFSTIFRPTSNAILPQLLRPAEMVRANGLIQSGTTVASFLGSPIGGIAVVTVGVAVGLAANALTFAVSGALISLMVVPAVRAGRASTDVTKPSLLSDVRDGLRYLRSQRALLMVTLSGCVANFFLSMFNNYEVVYVVDRLHLGATEFGLLVAAGGGGWAIGAILPGTLGADRAPGLWYPAAWGLAGVCILGLALVSTLTPAVGLVLGFGILAGLGNTTFLSAAQRTVSEQYLGRYFATDEAISFAMIPAGQVAGGLSIVAFGVGLTFLVAGIGAATTSFVLLASPAVRLWGRIHATTTPVA